MMSEEREDLARSSERELGEVALVAEASWKERKRIKRVETNVMFLM